MQEIREKAVTDLARSLHPGVGNQRLAAVVKVKIPGSAAIRLVEKK